MPAMRRSLLLVLGFPLAFAWGCKQQAPLVYVLESSQEVTLNVSASAARVPRGETVILHAERRSVGKWKQIPRDQLTPGQCWVYRPPPELESEVADNVEWEIIPDRGIQLDPTFRMDHSRAAQVIVPGKYTVTAYTPVACEKDRVVQGPTIEIEGV
jgi:hypothetical protein